MTKHIVRNKPKKTRRCLRSVIRIGRYIGPYLIAAPCGENHWLCVCPCGTKHRLSNTVLQTFIRRSQSPEFKTWRNMITRCYDDRHGSYPNYGGSGIIVDIDWFDYNRFLADMGKKPSAQHSLERIDSKGDYTATNCRWAIKHEQDRNRSSNRFLEHNGERLIITDWAKRFGISTRTIMARLGKGKSVGEAITAPICEHSHKQGVVARLVTYKGMTLTIRDWSTLLGIGYSAMGYRLRNMPLEIAMTMPVDKKQMNNGKMNSSKKRKAR